MIPFEPMKVLESNIMNSGYSWVMNDLEKENSSNLFKTLDTANLGYITGEIAREYFIKSGLPTLDLAKIWALSDLNSDGKLDLKEFQISVFLTKACLSGQILPSICPISLIDSVNKIPQKTTQSLNSEIQNNQSNSLYSQNNQNNQNNLIQNNQSYSVEIKSPTISHSNSTSSLNQLYSNSNSPIPEYSYKNELSTSPSHFNVSNSPINSSPLNNFSGNGSSNNLSPNSPSNYPNTSSNYSSNSISINYNEFSRSKNSNEIAQDSSLNTNFDDWTITNELKNTYIQYFARADENNSGLIAGNRSRELFLKSGLSNQTLSEIWRLSDMDVDGSLNLMEFLVSMHLINLSLRGFKLPSVLPPALLNSLENINPSKTETKQKDTTSGFDQKLEEQRVLQQFQKETLDAAALSQKLQEQQKEKDALASASLLQIKQQENLIAQQQAFQLKQEEEKKQLSKILEQIRVLLVEKEKITSALRAQQEKNIKSANLLLQDDIKSHVLKEEVLKMEIGVEKVKIKGASLRENTSILLAHIKSANEDKENLDSLIQQRQAQFTTESSLSSSLEAQIYQNKSALVQQKQDIDRLKNNLNDLIKSLKEAQAQKNSSTSQIQDPNIELFTKNTSQPEWNSSFEKEKTIQSAKISKNQPSIPKISTSQPSIPKISINQDTKIPKNQPQIQTGKLASNKNLNIITIPNQNSKTDPKKKRDSEHKKKSIKTKNQTTSLSQNSPFAHIDHLNNKSTIESEELPKPDDDFFVPSKSVKTGNSPNSELSNSKNFDDLFSDSSTSNTNSFNVFEDNTKENRKSVISEFKPFDEPLFDD